MCFLGFLLKLDIARLPIGLKHGSSWQHSFHGATWKEQLLKRKISFGLEVLVWMYCYSNAVFFQQSTGLADGSRKQHGSRIFGISSRIFRRHQPIFAWNSIHDMRSVKEFWISQRLLTWLVPDIGLTRVVAITTSRFFGPRFCLIYSKFLKLGSY